MTVIVPPVLFPSCAAGCPNVVTDPREVCAECIAALGDYIRPSAAEVSAEGFVAARAAAQKRVLEVLAGRATMRRNP